MAFSTTRSLRSLKNAVRFFRANPHKLRDRISRSRGCWPWHGAKNTYGYGVITWAPGEQVRVSRIVYWLHYGRNPKYLFVCHTCDRPECCNPRHLFLGSPSDNSQDSVAKDRTVFSERNNFCKLSAQSVRKIRRLYALGKHTYRGLGKQFGVSKDHIRLVVAFISRRRDGGDKFKSRGQSGVANGRAKIQESDVRAIRRLRAEGCSCAELGKKYKIHPSMISYICLRKTWAHVE